MTGSPLHDSAECSAGKKAVVGEGASSEPRTERWFVYRYTRETGGPSLWYCWQADVDDPSINRKGMPGLNDDEMAEELRRRGYRVVQVVEQQPGTEGVRTADDCPAKSFCDATGTVNRLLDHIHNNEHHGPMQGCQRCLRLLRPVPPESPEHQPDDEVATVLREHYLAAIECDPVGKRDRASCGCSLVDLGWHGSLGEARESWIMHVMGVLHG